MENEIEINGKKYIAKETIKDNVEGYIGVMDISNIFMVFNLRDEFIFGQIIKIPRPALTFKQSDRLDKFSMSFDKDVIFTKYGTKISYEMMMYSIQLLKILNHLGARSKIIPEVYEGWNTDLNEFKKDTPILITYNNYGVMIAPRVD